MKISTLAPRLTYYNDLVHELVLRDLKLRYRRSVLGLLWTLLNPLAQLLVLNLVFSRVLPLDIPNYPLFLFTGLLAWNWFQASMYTGTGAIVDNRELIRRPGFTAAVLPAVIVVSYFIHFLLALPILLIFMFISGIQFSSALLFLPVIFATQFILILGLVYFTAAIQVTFRDTQYLLGVLLFLGFYLTPVFYDFERYTATSANIVLSKSDGHHHRCLSLCFYECRNPGRPAVTAGRSGFDCYLLAHVSHF